ncbi:T-complex-associated testis-expressed protein 1 [Cichlidogyrus casuarinus]|uniref:T-complex-associated testis-expressed protein 1 n=1 Tax=Cichlidogyrus casuarinus TaxID=1844966 RepID=A0ABD2PQU2_9PLAT
MALDAYAQLLLVSGECKRALTLLRHLSRADKKLQSEYKKKTTFALVIMKSHVDVTRRPESPNLDARLEEMQKMDSVADAFSELQMHGMALKCYLRMDAIANFPGEATEELFKLKSSALVSVAECYRNLGDFLSCAQTYVKHVEWSMQRKLFCGNSTDLREIASSKLEIGLALRAHYRLKRDPNGSKLFRKAFQDALTDATKISDPVISREALRNLVEIAESEREPCADLKERLAGLGETESSTTLEVEDSEEQATTDSDDEDATLDSDIAEMVGFAASDKAELKEQSRPETIGSYRLQRNEKGETPLHVAAGKGDLARVRTLLSVATENCE